MSLGTELQTLMAGDPALAALVGTRIYLVRLPQGAAFPAFTYRVISGPRVHSTDGASGLAHRRVQFDAWAQTAGAARAAFAALEKLLDGIQAGNIQGAFFDTEHDEYEPDTRLYRHRSDFMIHWTEATT